jgi:hypothetical protein
MELMARPEELGSPECGINSARRAARERVSSGGGKEKEATISKGHDRSRESGEGLEAAGVGLPARHCAKAGGSPQRFGRTMKQGRKVADWWVS